MKQTIRVVAAVVALAWAGSLEAQGPSNDDYIKSLEKAIAGKENDPAETVFKNIQVMKGVPAGRLLKIMQMGFSPALGVTCEECHVPGEWASDEKDEKTAARGMMGMMREINEKLLPNVKGLDNANPSVNCTICHRGKEKPSVD